MVPGLSTRNHVSNLSIMSHDTNMFTCDRLMYSFSRRSAQSTLITGAKGQALTRE